MSTKTKGIDDSPQGSRDSRNQSAPAPLTDSGVSLRAVIIGLILIPILVYWAEYTEIVAKGADLIAMSLIMAVFFAYLVIFGLNILLARVAPKWVLTRNEMLTIYAMNAASIGICGLGMMQFLPHMLLGYKQFSTQANGWSSWTFLIPSWASPDPAVIKGFYDGHSSFFTRAHILGWLQPIIIWSLFIIVLFYCMYSLSVLLRRQWIHGEKLTFPIASAVINITDNDQPDSVWKKRLFWLGFGITIVLESLAALHYSLGPSFPYIPIKASEGVFNIGALFTTKPWTGIGGLQLGFYPLVIGLAFLLSLDVSFSCWFFFLLGKIQNAMAVYLGYRDATEGSSIAAPYIGYQGAGGFIAIALLALISAWPAIKKAHQLFVNFKEKYDDSDEPMPLRTAVLSFWISAALLICFGIQLGISWPIAILFFGLFLLYAVTVSRLRAEAGLPLAPGPPGGAHGTIINMGGTVSFDSGTLIGLTMFNWFDSDYRTMSMQNQIDAMYIADQSKINARRLTIAIMLAVVVAIAASWISMLNIYYTLGANSAKVESWRTATGHYVFEQLQSWLTSKTGFNTPALYGSIAGFVVVIFLSLMRKTYVWWPFHPIGYVAACTGLDWVWGAIFTGWFAKHLIIRYGGAKGYRLALPFFLGLIVGDYIAGPLWAIIYQVFNMSGYRTFPI